MKPTMNYRQLFAVALIACTSLFTTIELFGQLVEEGGPGLESAREQLELSEKAMELLEYYGRLQRVGHPNPAMIRWSSPGLLRTHVTEEYRKAWEELLLLGAGDEWVQEEKLQIVWQRVIESLVKLKATESVVPLQEAFRRNTFTKRKPDVALRQQKDILLVLNLICNAEAMEAIFVCFDLADGQDEERVQAKDFSGKTLRQVTFEGMLQTNNPGLSDFQAESLARGKKWQTLLSTQNRDALSENNKKFLDDAAAVVRGGEEE